MMSKPVVLLDCDGVLSDFVGGFLQIVHGLAHEHKLSDRVFTLDDVTQWDISKCPFFLTLEEKWANAHPEEEDTFSKRVWDRVNAPGFVASLPVLGGHATGHAILRIAELAEIFVVTSPMTSSPTWMHERSHWIENKFGISRRHVIHADRKHLIKGDLFIDDKPAHVEEWDEHNDGVGYLWDAPYNRAGFAGRRLQTWSAVEERVGLLARR